MGKHNLTRGDDRRAAIFIAIKSARHEPEWERGERSLLCDPGSELRLGRRENRRAKIINGMETKKRKEKKKRERRYRDEA